MVTQILQGTMFATTTNANKMLIQTTKKQKKQKNKSGIIRHIFVFVYEVPMCQRHIRNLTIIAGQQRNRIKPNIAR